MCERPLLTAYCLLLVLAGCSKPEAASKGDSAELPLQGVKLRLRVVGDPALAGAAGQLRGEWNAQTGADFEIHSVAETAAEPADVASSPDDAIICPAYLLGPLAEQKRTVSVPKRLQDSDEWSGVFELLRLREVSWATEVQAVPFGSPVFTCYYRADVLKKLGRRPPQTWDEYYQLAKRLADRKVLGEAALPDDTPWHGTIEPLGPGWAGLLLMARAAPYAKHRSNYSTFFDIKTMEPLVAGPPWVRALEELVAAAKLGPADQLQYDPAAVRAAFWQGRCGMALAWPTAAKCKAAEASRNAIAKDSSASRDGRSGVEVGFAELPGSRAVFDVGSRTWANRSEEEDSHVPLLSVAGRIGVVSAGSPQPEAALQLLLWLSGDRMSPEVCPASPATTLFRRSQVRSPRMWVEPSVSFGAAEQYAAVTERTLTGQQWLSALPLPGRADYLAALDAAVQRAVRGEQSPIDALHQAAGRWEQITQRLGVDRQRAAYLHSLGLE